MPRATRTKPTVSVSIEVHGLTFWTIYDAAKGSHSLKCDLCGQIFDAGPYGTNGDRLDDHRNKGPCYAAQRERAMQEGRDLPPLPAAARTSTAPSRPCFGAPYAWPLGPLWTTYPFQVHETTTAGWYPFTFDPPSNTIYFRSNNCEGTISGDIPSCRPCDRVARSPSFRDMQRRATSTKSNLRYDYMSANQSKAALRRSAAVTKRLRSQLHAANRSKRRWQRRAREQEEIMLFLAKRDVPRLRWVLTTALKRGTTPTRLLSILIRAADGTYRARGYSQRELDVSCLAAELGGPRLLYALGRSHGFLSKRTVRKHMFIPRLLPSIAVPTKAEIDTNITSFLDPEVSPEPAPLDALVSTLLPGHIMMIDGVAIEPRAGYCSRRNHAIGLSRETAAMVNTEVSTLESVETIRTALQDQRVRFGSEATVVAVAPYTDVNHYTPVPIAVSPSDKSEDAEQLLAWLQTAVSCWKTHQYAEQARGPIWSIATDGDATFRKAKHMLCTAGTITESSELWSSLSTLRGFNMKVSADGQTTWTCDPKHIFKRFATLLRSPHGIMLFDVNIRPTDIVTYLTATGGLSVDTAVQLLDPADKQNVPKAVALMQHLHDIAAESERSASTAAHIPTLDVRQGRIRALSEILWLFVRPFITPDMTLAAQLESLSAFSHSVAILQLKHGSSCLTGALYADTQATIKNIFVIVARLKRINPQYKLFLLLEGTDRLEQLFSETRTLDHARNFDTIQLSYKLSSGFLIHAIFQRNPDLDRGHRRLKLTNCMGIDHLNPKSWTGDVCVDNVDLNAVWESGREQAVQYLTAQFGAAAATLATRLSDSFSRPDYDVMRPDGHYVGVSGPTSDDERSERVEPAVTPHIPRAPVPVAAASVPVDTTELSPGEDTSELDPPVDVRPALPPSTEDRLPDGIDFDDLFPDTLPHGDDSPEPVLSNEPVVLESATFSKTLDDGKGGQIWKSALLATLSADRARTVTVRTLRAQGITLEDLRRKSQISRFDEPAVPEDVSVKTGTIMGFIARVGMSYALALLEISEFILPSGKRKLSLSRDEFESSTDDLQTKAIGQVLRLREARDPTDGWLWTRQYISQDGDDDARSTLARFSFEIPTAFLHAVTPTLVEEEQEASTEQEDSETSTAWRSLDPDSEDILLNLNALPTVKNTKDLPYTSQRHRPAFVVRDVPAYLQPEPKYTDPDTKLPCYLCGTSVSLRKMRDHVGRHILRFFRDLEDPLLDDEATVPDEPCGFCGRETCVTAISYVKNRASPKIHSSCGYHYEGMRYSSASTSTDSSPCSNVPIPCRLCPKSKTGHYRTVWKYNAAVHLAAEHSDEQYDRQLEASMFISVHISQKEEAAMTIPPDSTAAFRTRMDMPHSDDIREYEHALEDESAGKTRPRATTTESERADRPAARRMKLTKGS
ncbi:hypothetical protein EXIGLDRAFT_707060 [Exidia glandulosa HHB12029]|uniref:Uncharacterized protein n=1 Tax=Exidia glandulosa HHB12029 TaxID=1314781 RepID=A0A165AV09_EXIGL|nr:hypothetical protein EXIGLDRAFT_707060 [Exidia glandulosa HHB12029]